MHIFILILFFNAQGDVIGHVDGLAPDVATCQTQAATTIRGLLQQKIPELKGSTNETLCLDLTRVLG
jgi:hypothetical protein